MKRITPFLAIVGLFLCGVGMLAFLLEGRLTNLGRVHFILGGIGIFLFVLTRARSVIGVFRSRSARYGALVSVYVLIVAAVLVALNALGAVTSVQLADLTGSGLYTLAPQTRKVLDSLDEDLSLYAFFEGGRAGLEAVRPVDRLLRTFAAYSQKVKLEPVDPFIDPLMAEEYEITQDATLVLEYKNRTSKINTITEENITNALIRFFDDRTKVACFTTGHGEYSITGAPSVQIQGLGLLKKLLERKDYQVREVDLQSQREVPPDCTVVLMVGPRVPVSEGVLVMLDLYLQLGGRVFAAVDAGAQSGLEPLLARWGVKMGNNVVMEKVTERLWSSQAGLQSTTLKPSNLLTVTRYNRNYLVTQDLSQRHPTQYFKVRTMAPMETATRELKLVPLMWSKKDSWVETDVEGAVITGVAMLEPARGDRPGPVSLAVASSLAVPQGYSLRARLVAVGNALWLTNSLLNDANNFNSDLMLNMVGWLAGFEQYLQVAPRSTPAKHLNLRKEQKRELFNVTVIFIPELLLLIGALVWWVRR